MCQRKAPKGLGGAWKERGSQPPGDPRAPPVWIRSARGAPAGAAPAPGPALPSLPGRRFSSITSCRGLHEERCRWSGQGIAPQAARDGQPGRPGLLPAGLGQEGRRAARPGVAEEEIWYWKWNASVLSSPGLWEVGRDRRAPHGVLGP